MPNISDLLSNANPYFSLLDADNNHFLDQLDFETTIGDDVFIPYELNKAFIISKSRLLQYFKDPSIQVDVESKTFQNIPENANRIDALLALAESQFEIVDQHPTLVSQCLQLVSRELAAPTTSEHARQDYSVKLGILIAKLTSSISLSAPTTVLAAGSKTKNYDAQWDSKSTLLLKGLNGFLTSIFALPAGEQLVNTVLFSFTNEVLDNSSITDIPVNFLRSLFCYETPSSTSCNADLTETLKNFRTDVYEPLLTIHTAITKLAVNPSTSEQAHLISTIVRAINGNYKDGYYKTVLSEKGFDPLLYPRISHALTERTKWLFLERFSLHTDETAPVSFLHRLTVTDADGVILKPTNFPGPRLNDDKTIPNWVNDNIRLQMSVIPKLKAFVLLHDSVALPANATSLNFSDAVSSYANINYDKYLYKAILGTKTFDTIFSETESMLNSSIVNWSLLNKLSWALILNTLKRGTADTENGIPSRFEFSEAEINSYKSILLRIATEHPELIKSYEYSTHLDFLFHILSLKCITKVNQAYLLEDYQNEMTQFLESQKQFSGIIAASGLSTSTIGSTAYENTYLIKQRRGLPPGIITVSNSFNVAPFETFFSTNPNTKLNDKLYQQQGMATFRQRILDVQSSQVLTSLNAFIQKEDEYRTQLMTKVDTLSQKSEAITAGLAEVATSTSELQNSQSKLVADVTNMESTLVSQIQTSTIASRVTTLISNQDAKSLVESFWKGFSKNLIEAIYNRISFKLDGKIDAALTTYGPGLAGLASTLIETAKSSTFALKTQLAKYSPQTNYAEYTKILKTIVSLSETLISTSSSGLALDENFSVSLSTLQDQIQNLPVPNGMSLQDKDLLTGILHKQIQILRISHSCTSLAKDFSTITAEIPKLLASISQDVEGFANTQNVADFLTELLTSNRMKTYATSAKLIWDKCLEIKDRISVLANIDTDSLFREMHATTELQSLNQKWRGLMDGALMKDFDKIVNILSIIKFDQLSTNITKIFGIQIG